MIQPTRRGFLLGMLAAPVIVKASSLMVVKAPKPVPSNGKWYFEVHEYMGDRRHTREFSNLGLRPDFIWVKNRDAPNGFVIYDVVRK